MAHAYALPQQGARQQQAGLAGGRTACGRPGPSSSALTAQAHHTPATPAPAPRPSSRQPRHEFTHTDMTSGARTGRDEQQRRYSAACQDIKGCQSWLELQRVYQQLGHSLDHIQAVALLSGLAKTAPAATAPLNEVQEYRQLVAQVLTMTVASHAPRYAASNCTGIHADPAHAPRSSSSIKVKASRATCAVAHPSRLPCPFSQKVQAPRGDNCTLGGSQGWCAVSAVEPVASCLAD